MTETNNMNTFYEYEEEEFDDYKETYNHFPLNGKCMGCLQNFTEDELCYIEFNWRVIPRKQYGVQPYNDILSMYLCQFCHHHCKITTLIGWDKLDAIDGLSVLPKKEKQNESKLFISKL